MKVTVPVLLTIVFVVLKLCAVIMWSWWWVLCPMWFPIVLWMSVMLFCLAMAGLSEFFKPKPSWMR